MAVYEIPLSPAPQTFVIALASQVQYRLTVRWCKPAQYWIMDLDTLDAQPVLRAIPLVPGVDLLAQYRHLQLGGQMVVQTVGDPDKVPGFGDLGVSGLLFFVTEDV